MARNSPENTRFTIVGAGLAGPLMAAYLGRAGYNVDMYEKRPDLRIADAGPQRSINLALSVRGIHALAQAGLADRVLADAVPMRGRMIHSPGGDLSYQPYSKNESEVIYSVSRAALNVTLLNEAASYPAVRLFFQHECVGADLRYGGAQLQQPGSEQTLTTNGDILLAADGAFSAVRRRMQRLDRFDYQQEYLEHGYKELTIPPGPNGTHRLEKNALHIWPRRSFMMIALPNQDGSFTCTLFWPHEGPLGFASLRNEQDILKHFETHFPDAVPLIPTLAEDYLRNPVGALVTIRCRPWHLADKIVLVGDACHAVVPFYGQGINAGFEDCTVLDECLQLNAPNWQRAFEAYEARRKPHTDALAQLAYENFIEMRDLVGTKAFLRKKHRERLLHRWFPRWYVPLYSLVTFSRTPYADARRRAEEQERIVRRVSLIVLSMVALAFVWILWNLIR